MKIKENIKAPRHWPWWGEFTDSPNMCLNIHIYVTAICPFLPRVLNNDIPAFGKIKLHICRSRGIRWIYTFLRTHCNITLLFYHNLSVTVRWKRVNRVASKVSPGLSFSHSVSRGHLIWIIVPREYSIMNRWGETSWCLFSMGITRLNARYLPTFCRQFLKKVSYYLWKVIDYYLTIAFVTFT